MLIILSLIIIIFLISIFYFEDGMIYRPHPIVWRIARGVGIIYIFLLIYIFFQTRDEARSLMVLFSSKLGKELPERDYASDCRIYTPEKESKFYNLKVIFKNNKSLLFWMNSF
jgi:phosphatidylserine synthase 2